MAESRITSKNGNTVRIMRRTIPIPSPSVAENANRIWIIGSNQAISSSLSSSLREALRAWAWVRSTSEKDWELPHLSSCVAKGWVSRGLPVTLWYSLAAPSNIAVKLSDNREGPPAWLMIDIGGEISGKLGRARVVNEDELSRREHSFYVL